MHRAERAVPAHVVWAAAVVVLLLSPRLAASQWTPVAEIPATLIFSVWTNGDTIAAGADTAVYVSTNAGATWQRSAKPVAGVVAIEAVWIDRPDLDARIEARLHRMVDCGYFEEVVRVLAGGATGEEKPLRSFGYVHMVAWARGEIGREEAIRRTSRDTRRLARKQRTWARGLGLAAVADRAAVLAAAERAFGPR